MKNCVFMFLSLSLCVYACACVSIKQLLTSNFDELYSGQVDSIHLSGISELNRSSCEKGVYLCLHGSSALAGKLHHLFNCGFKCIFPAHKVEHADLY